MKKIYNTLTTAKSIREFLTDGGEIVVTYTRINDNPDFYNTKNVKKITCIFKSCEENGWTPTLTEMNKFFMRSLTTVAKATEVIKSNGEISIKFTLKENNDGFEAMENENRIINVLTEAVKNKIKELECIEHQYDMYLRGVILNDDNEDTYNWDKYYKDELNKLYAYVG